MLEQAGWDVAKVLQVPINIMLLHLPRYSPELNPVERLWAYVKSHYFSYKCPTGRPGEFVTYAAVDAIPAISSGEQAKPLRPAEETRIGMVAVALCQELKRE